MLRAKAAEFAPYYLQRDDLPGWPQQCFGAGCSGQMFWPPGHRDPYEEEQEMQQEEASGTCTTWRLPPSPSAMAIPGDTIPDETPIEVPLDEECIQAWREEQLQTSVDGRDSRTDIEDEETCQATSTEVPLLDEEWIQAWREEQLETLDDSLGSRSDADDALEESPDGPVEAC